METSPILDSVRPEILAVDDDLIILKILGNILFDEHNSLELAMSGKEALGKLGDQQWDLMIIIDVMMPDISGYELTQTIRERFSISELPILLLTTQCRPEDIFFSFRSGANDYVLKPMDTTELRFRVRSLTDLSEIDTSKMQKLIAIKLELVQAYLYIEKERFADRLEIVWEVYRNIDCR